MYSTPTTAPLVLSFKSLVALDHFKICRRDFDSAAYFSSCFWMAKIIELPARPVDGLCVLGNECPPSCPTRSNLRCSCKRPRSHASDGTLPPVRTDTSGFAPRPAARSVSCVYTSTLSLLSVLFSSTALTPEEAHAEFPPRCPFFSRIMTRPPRSSNVSAAESPARPPPTMIASAICSGSGRLTWLPRPRSACWIKRDGFEAA
mmetsp:Transcript_30936/g.64877  ORF Transcript_30936/g.64877 Transcript_30936/m.64877 type:complete len:203 (-) Transcript_30936:1697-2305(-)